MFSIIIIVIALLTIHYKMLINGRLVWSAVQQRFNRILRCVFFSLCFCYLCEECFREKMYHDPLNTQIMIAIERFHLFLLQRIEERRKSKTQTIPNGWQQQHRVTTSRSNSSINDKYCTPITVAIAKL